MNTPTPRTDAAWASSFEPCEYRAAHTARIMRECSQQLETELTTLTTERDQLRAEVKQWELAFQEQYARGESAEREAFDWKKIARYEAARAERAEREVAGLKANNRFQRGHSAGYAEAKADCATELATERARLADLVADLNDACITLESAENDCDDYAMQNTAFKLTAVRNVLLQHIPNAAMKEGAK